MSKPEGNIISEYIQLTQEYQQKYGNNTILLMQVGAFFEVYGLKDNIGTIHKSEIVEFSKVCNLNISEKKIIYNDLQVVMAGFRDYTLEKYLQKLTDAAFTAVVYTQEKEGKTITRKLHSIYSAGTYISYETDVSPQITNNIMCIWIESYKPLPGSAGSSSSNIIYGVACANIFTGKSTIFEHQTQYYMNPTTFDELERYVSIHSPSEILFISDFEESKVNTILQYAGIQSSIVRKINTTLPQFSEKTANCAKQQYIQHILTQFYGEEAYNVCAEFNTHTIAVQAYCYLLNFIQEHNPNLVRNIALPIFNNATDRMILANHTLKQLNIIDDKSNDGNSCGHLSSVLSFLNRCCSPMGKRRFQTQLLNPSYNEEWLKTEYLMIDRTMVLQQSEQINVGELRKMIGQIRDMDKICRQLIVHKVYPASIYSLYKGIQTIQQINYQFCGDHAADILGYLYDGICNSMNTVNRGYTYIDTICTNITAFIEQELMIESCKPITSSQTFDENIIQKGVSSNLDRIVEKYEKSQINFSDIHLFLNKQMVESEGGNQETEYIKIHETEKSGFTLQITKKRGATLKSLLTSKISKNIETFRINDSLNIHLKDIKIVAASGTNDEIDIPILNQICKDILSMKDELNKEIEKAYLTFLGKLEVSWFADLEKLSDYLSKLDVLLCKVYLAKEYKYCKPEILSYAKTAFVNVTELRHVLIEHIQQNEIYVENDIDLNESKGVLLYGTNAVGKTSFIRAVGISVIMAQSGMYVPCSKFIYKPYQAIFSRILGNDNIFKGLSTFAVEMSELRVILKMSDENSLILGDELCSGTETESALSIFMSGLIELEKNKSSFIFATHFHEIMNYDEMRELSNIRIMHMAVSYDREKDCLIYDRKLRDGPGNRMYGLEVCKSLYLPDRFLERAYSIRNKYHPQTKGELSHSTSVYNAKKIRGLCEMCKTNISEETHHLLEQQMADDDGYIGAVHKNHTANLMALCEKCHLKMHNPIMANDIPDISMGTSTKKPSFARKKTTKGYTVI